MAREKRSSRDGKRMVVKVLVPADRKLDRRGTSSSQLLAVFSPSFRNFLASFISAATSRSTQEARKESAKRP
jgi:hypothetical protein